jgi:hypothetical protein
VDTFLPIRIGFQYPLARRYGLWNGIPFFLRTAIIGRSMYEQDARNITDLPCSRCSVALLRIAYSALL